VKIGHQQKYIKLEVQLWKSRVHNFIKKTVWVKEIISKDGPSV
jgi:hypothetical protein